MIYEAFQARIDALVFPGHRGPELPAYETAVAEIDAEFEQALAAEYLANFAESQVELVAKLTYELAAEQGQYTGRGDIEAAYIDFAALANLAKSTGRN